MTLTELAAQIPAEYRTEILQMNLIGKAMATTADASMNYLGVIWKNYINADEKLDCGLCLERVLNNYRQMVPAFIELEQQKRLLDSI